MKSVDSPIVVIRGGTPPLPAVAAAAVVEGWPVLASTPLRALLRRLFFEQPEVAVVEMSAGEQSLLRTLRERRPEMSLVAVSPDESAFELLALTAGAHAWLATTQGPAAIRRTAHALRQGQRAPVPFRAEPLPAARATA